MHQNNKKISSILGENICNDVSEPPPKKGPPPKIYRVILVLNSRSEEMAQSV